MQCSARVWYLLFGVLLVSIYNELVNGYELNELDSTVYNRMICENEKLQIGCKEPNKVLNIQRAYYGRYSITPCNKNHIQYTMGCTANNTINVLKKLCQSKANCDIHASNSIFGNPCRNSTHVLEVIYNCFDEIKTQEKFENIISKESTELKETSFTKNSEAENKNSLSPNIEIKTTSKKYSVIVKEDEENIFESNKLSLASDDFVSKKNNNKDSKKIKHKTQCFFSENLNITKNFNFGNRAAAEVNQYINIPCSTDVNRQTGTKLFKCKSDGQFHYVNSTCAIIKNKWIEKYEKQVLSNKKKSIEIIEQINTDLKSGKANDILRPNKSIVMMVDLIKSVSTNMQTDKLSKEILLQVADTLIENNSSWKDLSRIEKSKSATKLFDVVESIIFQKFQNAEAESMTKIKPFSINTKNIIAEVSSNEELKTELNFPNNKDLETYDKAVVNIEDPDKSQEFMFVVYKSVNELFTSKNDLIGENTSKESKNTDEKKNLIVNSNIISFKMNHNKDIHYLKKVPIELTFKHIEIDDDYQQHEVKPVCSYWEYDKITFDSGHWSSDGCQVKTTNKTHTVCKCNHLTHFAILMDIYGVHENLPEIHENILTLITIICSIISCFSIIFTLLAFRFLKIIKKSREQSTTKDLTTITTHLCFCLFASLSVFLAGIIASKLKLKIFCSTIALISHYFFLCSFFWMLLEGVQLYFMLVRIFILDKSPIKRFCLIAYGLPFLIAFSSKLADYYYFDSLGYGTAGHCWISTYQHFNLTFIVPVSLIMFANFIILVIVIYGMRNSMTSRQTKANQKQDNFFKSLFGFWCIILTLLGLPWLIGYLILDTKATLIFSYLFTIVNSSQGTIVFIFHCVVSKNVREELLKIFRKRKLNFFSKESKKTTSSLFCYPTSSSRGLQRGPSDSSSFKSPRKFFDSVRLLDRKGSNCSSSQTNSTSGQNRNSGTNRPHNNSVFTYLYEILCSCFLTNETLRVQDYSFNKNIQNLQSFSSNSNNFNNTTQSPLRNYSSSLTGPTSNSFSKTINDENCVNLLQTEPCYNCQNTMCTNGFNQNYNKQILNSTLNTEKPTLLQMYLTNEASKNLYNQKYLYGNLQRNNTTMPNVSKMNRTSSHLSTCSNSSNNPTQTTYLSPISSTYLNNNNKNFIYVNNNCSNCQKINGSCQIPNMPPPPLPPFNANLNQFCGVNVCPPSTASFLRNKDSFTSNNRVDRFSTFKNTTENNYRLPPVPSRRVDNKKSMHQNENQYLQPECNTYSMVEDSEFPSESQYYCDDRICSLDEHNNMYSEVFEDYIDESNLYLNENERKQYLNDKLNKSNQKFTKNYKSKLKDLIAMPEEFDKDESIEHSHISDQDLFNLTSSVLRRDKLRMQESTDLVEIQETENSDTASNSPSSSDLSVSSTLLPASLVLNGLFTNT